MPYGVVKIIELRHNAAFYHDVMPKSFRIVTGNEEIKPGGEH